MTAQSPVGSVDLFKAGASQLIVWHHLALYGPMSDAVQPRAATFMAWLVRDARQAVQVFLVVAGYLAARSLLQRPLPPLPALLRRRYLRLARPYLIALAAAVACAWVARELAPHPTIPGTPTLVQLLAHALLLQDVLGIEALSAGVWYVAIDFQLHALLLAVLWLARGDTRLAFAGIAALALTSLFWCNRVAALDIWAPYFFGAYALGIGAWWVARQPRRIAGSVLLGVVVLLALALEWRSRLLLAGLTALALVWAPAARPCPPLVAALSRLSYPLFLIHYPVLLLVGAVVHRLWPGQVLANGAGLVAAWLASMAAAALLQRLAEPRGGAFLPRAGLTPQSAR